MTLFNYISFTLFSLFLSVGAQIQIDYVSNELEGASDAVELSENDLYFLNDKYVNYEDDKVDVEIYYESFCPKCIKFDKAELSPVVQKLHQYLNIHTYPYGNAKTFEHNGHYDFKCQHGPTECYGNKLHACAIDYIQNITTAVLFNACMMHLTGDGGSNDAAADRCASSMSLDSGPIKACAKQQRGSQLLKYYSDKSKKANFSSVPYILINGKPWNGRDNFMKAICAEFDNPPQPCLELYSFP